MRTTARKGVRAAAIAAAGACVAALAVVSVNTAEAATPTTTSEPSVALMNKTGNHAMGSMIRQHDGVTQQVSDAQAAAVVAPRSASSVVYGIDVSSWQGNVNWSYWWGQGKRFTWVKATEGTGYTNPYFNQQYIGSYNQGFIRGSYHFARPDLSGGSTQADYFIAHGGGWSADGKTLPGALDIEWGPNSACYGKSKSQMTNWILAFSDRYHARMNKWPIIYTATSWWTQCVGNSDFSSTNPLWVARYASSAGTLPYHWGFYTVWQYSSAGNMDKDVFSASYDRLKIFATNHD